jgi:nicotinic acid mononucleotide adenylyltransferase
VSSEAVLASYERQLTEAHRRIAMLEAALERERSEAAQVRLASQGQVSPNQSDPQEEL